jgi:hypothetical protein
MIVKDYNHIIGEKTFNPKGKKFNHFWRSNFGARRCRRAKNWQLSVESSPNWSRAHQKDLKISFKRLKKGGTSQLRSIQNSKRPVAGNTTDVSPRPQDCQ